MRNFFFRCKTISTKVAVFGCLNAILNANLVPHPCVEFAVYSNEQLLGIFNLIKTRTRNTPRLFPLYRYAFKDATTSRVIVSPAYAECKCNISIFLCVWIAANTCLLTSFGNVDTWLLLLVSKEPMKNRHERIAPSAADFVTPFPYIGIAHNRPFFCPCAYNTIRWRQISKR